jgi:hypothetical protein
MSPNAKNRDNLQVWVYVWVYAGNYAIKKHNDYVLLCNKFNPSTVIKLRQII